MISARPEEHGDEEGKAEGYGGYDQEILQVRLGIEDSPGRHRHGRYKVAGRTAVVPQSLLRVCLAFKFA